MTSGEADQGSNNSQSIEDILWKFLCENREAIAKKNQLGSILSSDFEDIAIRQDTEISELKEENSELRQRLAIAEGRLTRSEKILDLMQE